LPHDLMSGYFFWRNDWYPWIHCWELCGLLSLKLVRESSPSRLSGGSRMSVSPSELSRSTAHPLGSVAETALFWTVVPAPPPPDPPPDPPEGGGLGLELGDGLGLGLEDGGGEGLALGRTDGDGLGGGLGLGDGSCGIVAAQAHRAPALDCTRFVIDEIKRRLPIWKLEHYADGGAGWVDPTRPSGVAIT